MNPPPTVYVALGSNQGDPMALIRQAFLRLQTFSIQPLVRSSLWQTEPVDCPPGSPPFINAVAVLAPHPTENPDSLLDKLQSVEREFGRPTIRGKNSPRTLDLDLLMWGDLELHSDRLILPHPRMHLRRFVLQPLAEIAPDLIPPGMRTPIHGLLAQLVAQCGASSPRCVLHEPQKKRKGS